MEKEEKSHVLIFPAIVIICDCVMFAEKTINHSDNNYRLLFLLILIAHAFVLFLVLIAAGRMDS